MRKWIIFAAAAAIMAGLGACGGGSQPAAPADKAAPASKVLYVFNWIQYVPDSVIEKFKKEFGVDLVYDTFASNEEMFTKLKAGGSGYDVVFPGADYASIMIKEGMVEKLDKGLLPDVVANVDKKISALKLFDPADDYSVPYFTGCAGLIVNKEKVGAFEKSWSILERKDLKGKISLLDDIREVLGVALRYNGFSPNSVDPAQIAQAKATVLKWKGNLLKFDSESMGKTFASGDSWVTHTYAENVWLELVADPSDYDKLAAKYEFFIPKEGGLAYMDTMVILKDAPHKDLAYKFIDFIHRPEIYAEIADYIRVPCSNTAARAVTKYKPNYSLEDVLKQELKADVGEGLKVWNTAWDEIRAGS